VNLEYGVDIRTARYESLYSTASFSEYVSRKCKLSATKINESREEVLKCEERMLCLNTWTNAVASSLN
jgi:hypothetical protein